MRIVGRLAGVSNHQRCFQWQWRTSTLASCTSLAAIPNILVVSQDFQKLSCLIIMIDNQGRLLVVWNV